MKRNKRFPYYGQFLKARAQVYERDDASAAAFFGVTAGLVVLPFAAYGLFRATEILGLALAAIVGGGIVLGLPLSRLWNRRKNGPSREEQLRLKEIREAHGKYIQLLNQGRLHKNLDPTAAQLLEAAAYYHSRVMADLESPAWTNPNVTGHYAALRDQARRAADEAMDQLMALLVKCIGTPQRERKDLWKDALEDLMDLDIEDALQGFRQASKADSSSTAHQSPYIGALFHPAREIAEKLKMLSAEVERLGREATTSTIAATGVSPYASQIDLVLGEIKATQEAEIELENRLRGG